MKEVKSEPLSILWTLPDLEPSRGSGAIRIFSAADRSARANAFFWKCIIGGFVAIIIPPHVIYPIVGIAAGIIGKKSIQKQRYVFLSGQVTCPSCNKDEAIPKTNEEFPFLHFCTQCRARGEIGCDEKIVEQIDNLRKESPLG